MLQQARLANSSHPLIAAAVCGLAIMEYFKVLLNRDVSDLRNGQIDLGCNTYMLFERDPPKVNKSRTVKTYHAEHDYTEENEIVCVPNNFTKYDRLEFPVTFETTMGQFVEAYANKLKELGCGAFVATVAAGKGLVWSFAPKGKPAHANHDKSVLAIIAENIAPGKDVKEFWQNKLYYTGLVPNPQPDEGDEIETPTVVLVLPRAK